MIVYFPKLFEDFMFKFWPAKESNTSAFIVHSCPCIYSFGKLFVFLIFEDMSLNGVLCAIIFNSTADIVYSNRRLIT